MAIITDKEFGEVAVRRSSRSRHITIKVAPSGNLHASLPLYTPLFMLKRLLASSRAELRTMLESQRPHYELTDGMAIGKSHTLTVRPVAASHAISVARSGQRIIVSLPRGVALSDPAVTTRVRDTILKALRIEAKNYLPRRLTYLASQLDCHYERIRFSHASSRWGSCSSSGTISLNIALMKLPHDLIDYVLVHELCHTKQMNHSRDFWRLVEQGDPQFKHHRSLLKTHTPHI